MSKSGKTISADVDDLYINEDVASATQVAEHLLQFVPTCKASAQPKNGTRILGLDVWREDDLLL